MIIAIIIGAFGIGDYYIGPLGTPLCLRICPAGHGVTVKPCIMGVSLFGFWNRRLSPHHFPVIRALFAGHSLICLRLMACDEPSNAVKAMLSLWVSSWTPIMRRDVVEVLKDPLFQVK